MHRNISLKGVIIGSVVDIVGTNIWLFVVSMYLAIERQLYTLPPDERLRELRVLHDEPVVQAFDVVAGAGFSIVGGYLAARIAAHHERLNGTLTSFLPVSFSLLSIGSVSIGWLIYGVLGTPMLGLLGSYLWLWQKRSRD
jgi:hypothetical protein